MCNFLLCSLQIVETCCWNYVLQQIGIVLPMYMSCWQVKYHFDIALQSFVHLPHITLPHQTSSQKISCCAASNLHASVVILRNVHCNPQTAVIIINTTIVWNRLKNYWFSCIKILKKRCYCAHGYVKGNPFRYLEASNFDELSVFHLV